jgi:hypothetical protein
MKAAVWYGRQDVRVEDVANPPEPPPRQLQVEVAWCGICGTDLHEYIAGPVYIRQHAPHPLTSVRATRPSRASDVGAGDPYGPRRAEPCCGRSGGRLPHHRLSTMPLVPIRLHGAMQ